VRRVSRQRLRFRRRHLLAVAAALLLTAALGVATAGAASPPKVNLGDNYFKPTKLTVTAGTTVTWTWIGSNLHNVTVVGGPQKFHSRDLDHGQYTRTLTKTGTYRIVCTFHPGMTMTLKVTKAPRAKKTTTPSS
jgi:plastocyanin